MIRPAISANSSAMPAAGRPARISSANSRSRCTKSTSAVTRAFLPLGIFMKGLGYTVLDGSYASAIQVGSTSMPTMVYRPATTAVALFTWGKLVAMRTIRSATA